MLKINTNTLPEESWSSPKGKFAGFGKEVSEALGRKPLSTDLMERHPFDLEICRIPPGHAKLCSESTLEESSPNGLFEGWPHAFRPETR